MEDAKIAVQTGVDGLDVVIGTSSYLREHSHGKDMTYIKNAALEASLPYMDKVFFVAQETLFCACQHAHPQCKSIRRIFLWGQDTFPISPFNFLKHLLTFAGY